MSVTLSIKKVPETIAHRLRIRADRNRRSLQDELMTILEEAVKTSFYMPNPILAKEQALSVETPANSQVFYLADYLIDSSVESSTPKTVQASRLTTTPDNLKASLYAIFYCQAEQLTIIRDDELNVFVAFPKQLSGKLVLSENKNFSLVSTQKGDWFKVQHLNFHDLQTAVQNDQKTDCRTVRLEFSLIETEIKHTPGICGGEARIRNTRIPVWTLVSLRQQGATDSDLLDSYPSLIQSDLEAAWKYYQHHQDEILTAMASQDED